VAVGAVAPQSPTANALPVGPSMGSHAGAVSGAAAVAAAVVVDDFFLTDLTREGTGGAAASPAAVAAAVASTDSRLDRLGLAGALTVSALPPHYHVRTHTYVRRRHTW
jgi:hypothetical protein